MHPCIFLPIILLRDFFTKRSTKVEKAEKLAAKSCVLVADLK